MKNAFAYFKRSFGKRKRSFLLLLLGMLLGTSGLFADWTAVSLPGAATDDCPLIPSLQDIDTVRFIDGDNNLNDSTVEGTAHTFYWTFDPYHQTVNNYGKPAEADDLVDLRYLDNNGDIQTIEMRRDLFWAYHLEGSGFYKNDDDSMSIINLHTPDPDVKENEPFTANPAKALFMKIDQEGVWGLDSPYTNYGLVPFKTIAVKIRNVEGEPYPIPLGSWVYVPAFDGWQYPVPKKLADGKNINSGDPGWNIEYGAQYFPVTDPGEFIMKTHNGWFQATDISWSLPPSTAQNIYGIDIVENQWFDMYVGTYANFVWIATAGHPLPINFVNWEFNEYPDVYIVPYTEVPVVKIADTIQYRYAKNDGVDKRMQADYYELFKNAGNVADFSFGNFDGTSNSGAEIRSDSYLLLNDSVSYYDDYTGNDLANGEDNPVDADDNKETWNIDENDSNPFADMVCSISGYTDTTHNQSITIFSTKDAVYRILNDDENTLDKIYDEGVWDLALGNVRINSSTSADGDYDLIILEPITNWNDDYAEIRVMKGNGDGTFDSPELFWDVTDGYQNMLSVAAGDLFDDGYDTLICCGLSYVDPITGDERHSVAYFDYSTGCAKILHNPTKDWVTYEMEARRMDPDSKDDLLIVKKNCSGDQALYAFYSSHNLSYSPDSGNGVFKEIDAEWADVPGGDIDSDKLGFIIINLEKQLFDYNLSKSKIKGGTFDADWGNYWILYVHPDAEAEGYSIDNEFRSFITDGGNEMWHVQLMQEDILLKNGKKYELRFEARSVEAPRMIYALLEENGNDYTVYSGDKEVNITQTMEKYSIEFTMNYPTDDYASLCFDLGINPIDVIIDNVALYELWPNNDAVLWEIYTYYYIGDRVACNGAIYICTYEHESAPGWEPDNPVMWAVWEEE